MLDDYNKGDFLARRRCDHDDWAKYVYLDMRTYRQQIEDVIESDPEEIFICVDPRDRVIANVESFISYLLELFRSQGYFGRLIFSFINEPLERFTVPEVHSWNRVLAGLTSGDRNAFFAVGEMACNFFDYYRSFLRCDYSYDYISFHTDNSCNLRSLRHFLEIFLREARI